MSEQPPPPYGPPAPPPGPGQPPMRPEDERTWATMAHVLTIPAMLVLMAFLAPLVVLFVYGNRSTFVRENAVESLNFQITALVIGAVAAVASLVTLGLALFLVVPLGIVYAVFWVVVIVRASQAASRGELYRYPLTLRLVS